MVSLKYCSNGINEINCLHLAKICFIRIYRMYYTYLFVSDLKITDKLKWSWLTYVQVHSFMSTYFKCRTLLLVAQKQNKSFIVTVKQDVGFFLGIILVLFSLSWPLILFLIAFCIPASWWLLTWHTIRIDILWSC